MEGSKDRPSGPPWFEGPHLSPGQPRRQPAERHFLQIVRVQRAPPRFQ